MKTNEIFAQIETYQLTFGPPLFTIKIELNGQIFIEFQQWLVSFYVVFILFFYQKKNITIETKNDDVLAYAYRQTSYKIK